MWHTSSKSKSDVLCVYEAVVSEVIEGSRELCREEEEGCDEIVFDLLKGIWLRKLFEKNVIPENFMCDIENNNTIHTPNLDANSNSSKRKPQKSKNNRILKKARSVAVTKRKYNNPIGVCGRSMPDLNEHLAINENVNCDQLNKSLSKETEPKEVTYTSMSLRSKQRSIQPQPIFLQTNYKLKRTSLRKLATSTPKHTSMSLRSKQRSIQPQPIFLQTNYKLKRTCLRKPPTSTPKHLRSKDTRNLQLDLEQSKESSTSNIPVECNIDTFVQNHDVLLNSDKLDAHESTLNSKSQICTETKTSSTPGLVPNNIKNNAKVQIGLLDFMEEDLFKSITSSETLKPVQNSGVLLNPELAIISKKEFPNNNVFRNTRECVILQSTSHNIVQIITKNIEKGKEFEVCVLPKTILNPKFVEQPLNHNCLREVIITRNRANTNKIQLPNSSQNSNLLAQAEVSKENKDIPASENVPIGTTLQHTSNDEKVPTERNPINKDIVSNSSQNSNLLTQAEVFKKNKYIPALEDRPLSITEYDENDKNATADRTLVDKDQSVLNRGCQNLDLLIENDISKEKNKDKTSKKFPLSTTEHDLSDKKMITEKNVTSQNSILSTQGQVSKEKKNDEPLTTAEHGLNNQELSDLACQNSDMSSKALNDLPLNTEDLCNSKLEEETAKPSVIIKNENILDIDSINKPSEMDRLIEDLSLLFCQSTLDGIKLLDKNTAQTSTDVETIPDPWPKKNTHKCIPTIIKKRKFTQHVKVEQTRVCNKFTGKVKLIRKTRPDRIETGKPVESDKMLQIPNYETLQELKDSVIHQSLSALDKKEYEKNTSLANQSGKHFVLQDIPNVIFAPEDVDNMELNEETKGCICTVFTENQNIPLNLSTKNICSCARNQPLAPKEKTVLSETETLLSSESNNLDFNKQINSKSTRTTMTKSPQSDILNLKRRIEQPPPFKKIFVDRGTSPILTVSNKESQLSSVFQDSPLEFPEQNESLAHPSVPSTKRHLETGENSGIQNTKKVILKRRSFKDYNILCCSKDVHLPENYCLENQNSVKECLNDHIDDTTSTYVSQQTHENVKIILPARPGTTTNERTCFLRVPSWLLQEGRFPSILTPLMSKISNMSTPSAKYFLQGFIDGAQTNIKQECIVIQCDGPANNPKFRLLSKVRNTPIKVTKRRVGDTEISSDDDVTDEENPEQVFESDNTIICQFTLVKYSRNKWKIHLKNGVMHIDGKDYFFSSITGTVEW